MLFRSVRITSCLLAGKGAHDDLSIWEEARRQGRVLLTMDRGFWNDRRFPLQKCPGVIFLDVSPDKAERAVDALAVFFALFAQHYPLDWWDEIKVRVRIDGFVIKMRTWEGRDIEEEYRLASNGKLWTRAVHRRGSRRRKT